MAFKLFVGTTTHNSHLFPLKGTNMSRATWRRHMRIGVTTFGLSAIASFAFGVFDSRGSLFAAEDTAKAAVTVDEVIKVIDLRTLTLPEGAVAEGTRQVGTVNYSIKADPKKAFQVQQQQLVKLGWKELPGSMTEAASTTHRSRPSVTTEWVLTGWLSSFSSERQLTTLICFH